MTCPISQQPDSYPQPGECIAYIRQTRTSPNHWSKHKIPIEQTIKADGVSFLKNGHFQHNQVVIKAVFLAGTFQFMYFCSSSNSKLNCKPLRHIKASENFNFSGNQCFCGCSSCICLTCREQARAGLLSVCVLVCVCLQLCNYETRVSKIPVEQISVSVYHNIYLLINTHTLKNTSAVCVGMHTIRR